MLKSLILTMLPTARIHFDTDDADDLDGVVEEVQLAFSDTPLTDSRFLVLFRRRLAAHMCVASAGVSSLQLFGPAMPVNASAAPAPRDALWHNLLPPKPGRAVVSALALVTIWAL